MRIPAYAGYKQLDKVDQNHHPFSSSRKRNVYNGRLKLVFLADIHLSIPSLSLRSALLQQHSYPSLNERVTFSLGISHRSCFEFKLQIQSLPRTHPRTLDLTREFDEDARWRDGLFAEL